MRWFKRRARSSRPPEVITQTQIRFAGEQAGPVEDGLKARLVDLFAATPAVQAAYLARLSYDDTSDCSIGLCVRSEVPDDQRLLKQVAQIFADMFRSDEHLDILFVQEDEEAELKKVCNVFYERS